MTDVTKDIRKLVIDKMLSEVQVAHNLNVGADPGITPALRIQLCAELDAIEYRFAELTVDYNLQREETLQAWSELAALKAEYDDYKRRHPSQPMSDIDAGAREDMLYDQMRDEQMLRSMEDDGHTDDVNDQRIRSER